MLSRYPTKSNIVIPCMDILSTLRLGRGPEDHINRRILQIRHTGSKAHKKGDSIFLGGIRMLMWSFLGPHVGAGRTVAIPSA